MNTMTVSRVAPRIFGASRSVIHFVNALITCPPFMALAVLEFLEVVVLLPAILAVALGDPDRMVDDRWTCRL